jgi:hypothetical protein
MIRNNKWVWRGSVLLAVLIILTMYSPLVIKEGKLEPFFLGLPYTLWMSMALTIAIVLLTYIGGVSMPEDEEDSK